jgi:hypothetical protein
MQKFVIGVDASKEKLDLRLKSSEALLQSERSHKLSTVASASEEGATAARQECEPIYCPTKSRHCP